MKKHFLLFTLFLLSIQLYSQSSDNLNLLGSLNYPGTECNDVWGYVDSSGREYALVGLRNGFSVVDISDPTNPTESFFIAGAQSIWRDIKVWNNYAFVTADQGSGGLLIVNLNDLSGNTYVNITIDNNGSYMFTHAHNIYIDETGKAYIFGGDITPDQNTSGSLILDVTNVSITPTDTVLPLVRGLFDNFYLHDGMARGDTLWGSAVYEGKFFAIDVSDPTNPVIFNDSLAFHETPNLFTHNCWISDDGNTLYTTDEKSGAYIASYDVSDLDNIEELDRIQSSPGSEVIPHNAHVLGDYLVTSYYRDGIVVHDITYPNHMVEVAHYDAYYAGGDGFDGSWGAYPYLPSGVILSSEINSGSNGEGLLLVLEPDYMPASFLQGTITDSLSGAPINDALVRMLTFDVLSTSSNIAGDYFIGIDDPNTYNVEFSKSGYFTDTLQITLTSGGLVTQNVKLLPKNSFSKTGKVVNSGGQGIPNSQVMVISPFYTDTVYTNSSGEFTLDTLFQANYTFYVGHWGYKTTCNDIAIVNDSTSLTLPLDSSYYDDFTFDFGWEASGDASEGFWEIGNPNPTIDDNQIYNSSQDIESDCYVNAYITGNAVGGGAGADDVDDGFVLLKSPVFDLTSYYNPAIKFYQWFANGGGWSVANDSMNIYLDNGQEQVLVSNTVGQLNNLWLEKNINVSQFISATSEMRFLVKVTDYSPDNHLSEGGIDGFEIYEDTINPLGISSFDLENEMIYPNPSSSIINIPIEGVKKIYNSSGQLMLTSVEKVIRVSELNSGIYFVLIEDKYFKFVKL